MNISLEDITSKLQESGVTPGQLSEYRLWLSGHYSYISSLYEELIIKKPAVWLKLREQVNSDAQAEKHWEASEDGLREKVYRLQLKRMEKLMSAIKTRLEVLEGERKNQW